jgi:methyl-accepting chemotaxis protein
MESLDSEVASMAFLGTEYAVDSDPATAQAAQAQNEMVKKALAAVRANITDPQYQSALDDIAQKIDGYFADFAILDQDTVKANKLNSAQMGVQMKAIQDALAQVKQEAADAGNLENVAGSAKDAIILALKADSSATSFLSTGESTADHAALDNLKALLDNGKLDELKRLTATAPMAATVEKVTGALKSYQTAYDEAAGLTRAIDTLVEQKIGPELKDVNEKVDAMKVELLKKSASKSAEIDSTATQAYQLLGAIGAIALVFALLIGFVCARSIAGPVRLLTVCLGRLAQRDWQTVVPGTDRRDELGAMAQATEALKAAGRRADETAEQEKLNEVTRLAERRKSMLDLADRFESSVGGVVNGVTSAATELQSTAQSMASTAEETARQTTVVAGASEEMTQNVQTVASATEELTASIGEITNQMTETTKIVGEAVVQANDTNAKVQGLAEAAQKIGEVVRIINDIAGQTNLLALNATIEAARAGEMGKGFAVVASEVKTLATQTAKATDEIAAQVRAIQEATTSSAEAIDGITKTINRVSEISTAIASAVEEQGAATQEISRNVQQAAQGTQEVSSNIGGVTQAAQQTGAAAGEVLTAAAELGKNGVLLKTQVEDFLRTVRAG